MPNLSYDFAGGGAFVADSITVAGAATIGGRTTSAGFSSSIDGTLAAAAFNWSGDPNTGLFRSATDRFEAVTGGTERQYWSNAITYVYALLQAITFRTTFFNQNVSSFFVTTPRALQSITAVGQSFIEPNSVVPFDANASYVLTSTPQLINGDYDGQMCTLINVDAGADVVTFSDESVVPGSNLRLGAAVRALGPRDVLHLMWVAAFGDWIEIGFANNL